MQKPKSVSENSIFSRRRRGNESQISRKTGAFKKRMSLLTSSPTFFRQALTVQLYRMRVNPTLLRAVTWADMIALTTNWTQWLVPDQINESTNSSIVNFVQQSLPSNYRTSLTPYDTARP